VKGRNILTKGTFTRTVDALNREPKPHPSAAKGGAQSGSTSPTGQGEDASRCNRADATSHRTAANALGECTGALSRPGRHKWIRVRARLRHDKGHIVRHQAGDEMDITAQPIELGGDDRRLVFARGLERRGQLPPAIGRV
jgi:hypothetical protein